MRLGRKKNRNKEICLILGNRVAAAQPAAASGNVTEIVVKTGPSFLQFFENGCGSRAGEAAVAVAAGSGSGGSGGGGKCDRQQAHRMVIEADVDFAEAAKS